MKTIELTAVVGPDRRVTVQLPPDVTPGTYQFVVVIDGTPSAPKPPVAAWPVHDVGPWPADLSLRREDLYGDDGR
jgi:hypothetical protein